MCQPLRYAGPAMAIEELEGRKFVTFDGISIGFADLGKGGALTNISHPEKDNTEERERFARIWEATKAAGSD